MVGAEVDERAVVLSDVLVNAPGQHPLGVKVAHVGYEAQRARGACGQARESSATAAWHRRSTPDARSTIEHVEELRVELPDGRSRSDVRQRGRLELRAGNQHGRAGRQQYAETFRVHEEERLVVDDRSAD